MEEFVEEAVEENEEEDLPTQDTFEDMNLEDLIDEEGTVENVCD